MKNVLRNSNFGFTKWCIALTVAVLAMSNAAQAQTTTLLTTQGGGGALPTGWTSIDAVVVNTIDKLTYWLVDAGASKDFIISSTYDCSSFSSVIINVQVATFGSGTNLPLRIECSTDDGVTWSSTTYTTGTPTSSTYIVGGPVTISQTFTSTTKFRFSANGSSGKGVRIQGLGITAVDAAGPLITPSVGALAYFSTPQSVPSSTQSFLASGSNLSGSVIVTPPSGFEISTSSSSGFGNSLTLSPTGSTLASTQIFVRLAGTTSGSFSGNISISGGGTTTQNVAVSGIVMENTLAAWDFTGEDTLSTSSPEVKGLNLSGTPSLTRGSGATASSGGNSFRTTGFLNNGIATTNTDYFEISLEAAAGYGISISTLDARFVGTASFYASLGVSAQFAYSLDGVTFKLIGSPFVMTTAGSMPQISLSSISELQNVPSGTSIKIRYFATGQTTTGGWGFSSPGAGQFGLVVGGTSAPANSPVVASPIFDTPGGTYYENKVVSISNFSSYGNGIEVRYTTDGSAPSSLSALYSTDVGIPLTDGNGEILLRAVAINTATSATSAMIAATYTFPINKANVSELKAAAAATTPMNTTVLYRVTGQLTYMGGYTTRNTKFFQDSNAGIQVDDLLGAVTTIYSVGDNVQNIIGKLSSYQGQLQFVPQVNFGSPVSSGNAVTPVNRTLATLTDADQSMLVRLDGVQFQIADGLALFGALNNNLNIKDPSISGFTGVFRNIFGGALNTTVIPGGAGAVTGIVQKSTISTVPTLTIGARSSADLSFNQAPTITSGGAVSVAENQTAAQKVTGTDPDAGTTLGYRISGGEDSAKFVINSSTGVLTFASAPDFESPTDVGANNVYDIIVEVSDGTLTGTKALAVTVTNVTDSPADYKADWLSANSLAADSNWNSDPNSVGYSLATAYAFGLNPRVRSGTPTTLVSSPAGSVKVVYLQRDISSGVTYAVKTGTDLATGLNGNDAIINESASQPSPAIPGYTRYEATYTPSAPATKGFLKVEAIVP